MYISYKTSVTKYQPTYRTEPKIPYNREKCEIILKKIIDKAMIEFEYSTESAIEMCEQLSQDLKNRVKNLEFDRFGI